MAKKRSKKLRKKSSSYPPIRFTPLNEKTKNVKVGLDIVAASTTSIIFPPDLILKVDYSETSPKTNVKE